MSSYRRAFDEFSFSKIVLILILNVILKNGAWKRSFGGVTVIAICSVNFEKACIKWDRASGDQARYMFQYHGSDLLDQTSSTTVYSSTTAWAFGYLFSTSALPINL